MSVFLTSNVDSPDILIRDIGIVISGFGAQEEITGINELRLLQTSSDLRELASDDFGNGDHSLTISDGTNTIAPEDLDRFLISAFDDPPTKASRDSIDRNIIYVGRKLPGAGTQDPEWQIYRIDLTQEILSTREFADGDNEYNNVWDNRENLTYST